MTQILQKNNLGDCIPEGAKKKNPEDQNPKKDNSSHALIAINSSYDAWIIDSRASHHMAATKKVYSYLDACKCPPILMGDNILQSVNLFRQHLLFLNHVSHKVIMNINMFCLRMISWVLCQEYFTLTVTI
jgi:hypothetical protein